MNDDLFTILTYINHKHSYFGVNGVYGIEIYGLWVEFTWFN